MKLPKGGAVRQTSNRPPDLSPDRRIDIHRTSFVCAIAQQSCLKERERCSAQHAADRDGAGLGRIVRRQGRPDAADVVGSALLEPLDELRHVIRGIASMGVQADDDAPAGPPDADGGAGEPVPR